MLIELFQEPVIIFYELLFIYVGGGLYRAHKKILSLCVLTSTVIFSKLGMFNVRSFLSIYCSFDASKIPTPPPLFPFLWEPTELYPGIFTHFSVDFLSQLSSNRTMFR